MRRILDTLTSRRTSIALMAFVAVFGALGAWVPQSSNTDAATMASWEARNPAIAGIADTLGLHAVFSSWWFLVALGVFALALAAATVRIIADARRWQRGAARPARTELPRASAEEIVLRARAAGFRERRTDGPARVFVRHGIGVWASAVLHVGLLISLVAAAIALALTSGAILDLSVGEVRMPGDEYYAIEDASSPPEFGSPMRLDGIATEVWPSGGLKEVSASLSTLGDDGIWTPRTVRINHPLRLNGNTIYAQPGEFGDAVLLILTTADGTQYPVRMEFFFAEEGQFVYAEEPLTIEGAAIEGRWDPYGIRDAKPLGLRPAGDRSATPVTLAPGESAVVAGLSIEFVGTTQWARFIVQREPGVTLLLLGFAIIGLGSVMLYAWIPRELVLEETDEGVRYSWHAARMSRAYLSERDAILGLESPADEDT
ncbi:MAG: cytochrome c biogenesis protein ResB [Coriobacteriia bacterium]